MPFYGGVRGAWGGAAAEVCKIQGEAFCGGTSNSSWQGSPPPCLAASGCLPTLALGVWWLPPLPGWWRGDHSPQPQGGEGHYASGEATRIYHIYDSFHLWWHENFVKHQNVSKYYDQNCRFILNFFRSKQLPDFSVMSNSTRGKWCRKLGFCC